MRLRVFLPCIMAASAPIGLSGQSLPFDRARAWVLDSTQWQPLQVTETVPLREALRSGRVADETSVMVVELSGTTLALATSQMAYHRVAQGSIGGRPWMVSFCISCNTGVRLTPLVDGRLLHLEARGIYDGVTLLRDNETGSLWHHLTGTALDGPLVGKRLAPIDNVLQTTVKATLASHPDAVIALSDRPVLRTSATSPLLARVPVLGALFRRTISKEDTRRPTMEVGLGIWVDGGPARYYPLGVLQQHEGYAFDALAGRRTLIVYDPGTGTPGAYYTEARTASWDGATLRLNTGETIRHGSLYDQRGTLKAADRPLQVFTRWYGFALTFPETSIYDP